MEDSRTRAAGWWQYLSRIAGDLPRKEIARMSGVDPSQITRWKSGEADVRAENAVQFARAFGRPPVEALVAAGYLHPEEAQGDIAVLDSGLQDLSLQQLFDEIERRVPDQQRRGRQLTVAERMRRGHPKPADDPDLSPEGRRKLGRSMPTDEDLAALRARKAVEP